MSWVCRCMSASSQWTFRNRLDLAVAITEFVTRHQPKQHYMAKFLKEYTQSNGGSRSWAYGVLDQLKTIGIIKWDNYYREYHPNMNRWERDWERVRAFRAQMRIWESEPESF